MNNQWYLGIDQGYTKTSLILLSDTMEVLHVDEERTSFNRLNNKNPPSTKPGTRSLYKRYSERLWRLLNKLRIPGKIPVNVYFATNGGLSDQEIYTLLRQKGVTVASLEQFSDVHAHYGLTDMPGKCIVYVCGSYYNLMYYDKGNNVTCLQDRYWDATSWGSGLCAYSLGNFILDAYAESCLNHDNDELIKEVENQIGISRKESIYDYIRKLRLYHDRGYVMQLAPLISEFTSDKRIIGYVEKEAKNSGDSNIKAIFLGGGVFANNRFVVRFVVDAIKYYASNVRVETITGNPALGAIRFRLRNPNSKIATWQPKR